MNTEAKFHQTGDTLDYTPAAAVVAGQVVQAGGRAGIAVAAIAASVLGAVRVKGVIEVNKAQVSGNVGDPVGWDEDGDPYNGTAGSGALTTSLFNMDFLVGSLTAAAAATDETAKVALNEYVAGQPTFEGFTFEEISADKTLDVQDVGKAFIATADATPTTFAATAAPLGDMAFINGGADGAIVINLSPDSNDKFMGPDIAGANNKDLINTKLTANHWDYVIVGPDVAGNGLEVKKIRGTWATEG